MSRLTWTSSGPIHRLLRAHLHELGHPDLKYRLVFDRRYVHIAGEVTWPSECQPAVIRLSDRLWPRMTPDDRRETLIHELCHLTAFVEVGAYLPGEDPHCSVWYEHMAHVGYHDPALEVTVP